MATPEGGLNLSAIMVGTARHARLSAKFKTFFHLEGEMLLLIGDDEDVHYKSLRLLVLQINRTPASHGRPARVRPSSHTRGEKRRIVSEKAICLKNERQR